MNQKIVREAQNNLRQRKVFAESEYQNQLSKLRNNEKFALLEKSMIKLQIENAKKAANGEMSDEVQLQKLQQQINNIKQQNSVPQKPNYFCQKCNDEGFKNGQMCTCLKQEISAVLLKNSGFSELESFETSTESTDNPLLYEKMQQWCNGNFKKNLIFIAGPTGVGKTHLIRCMANELIRKGYVVNIATAFEMNQDFRAFSRTSNEQLLDQYLSCEVLFIDDLGTEPIYKNVTVQFYYLIINERKMRKLPTIITSNLTLEDVMNRYEERIFSRICDRKTSITIFVDGEDKRLKK